METEKSPIFIGAVSFEERCLIGVKNFLSSGGNSDSVRLVKLAEDSDELRANVKKFDEQEIKGSSVDRVSSRAIWDWVWQELRNAVGEVIVDATCLPREVLGMVLFALSVKRPDLKKVSIFYTSAPSGGYATQNNNLESKDQWLSQGILAIRSILGFPGKFACENRRHVLALAGHEEDRLMQIIEFLEPNKLSISNEQERTSMVDGAEKFSRKVVDKLNDKIALPEIGTIKFSANSIEETFNYLQDFNLDLSCENISLVAMNTKLSFIGAALFALHRREVRLIYAVPETYNPLYCFGVGEFHKFDITNLIGKARTTPVRSNQEK